MKALEEEVDKMKIQEVGGHTMTTKEDVAHQEEEAQLMKEETKDSTIKNLVVVVVES